MQTSIWDKNRRKHTDNDMFGNSIFLKIDELWICSVNNISNTVWDRSTCLHSRVWRLYSKVKGKELLKLWNMFNSKWLEVMNFREFNFKILYCNLSLRWCFISCVQTQYMLSHLYFKVPWKTPGSEKLPNLNLQFFGNLFFSFESQNKQWSRKLWVMVSEHLNGFGPDSDVAWLQFTSFRPCLRFLDSEHSHTQLP